LNSTHNIYKKIVYISHETVPLKKGGLHCLKMCDVTTHITAYNFVFKKAYIFCETVPHKLILNSAQGD